MKNNLYFSSIYKGEFACSSDVFISLLITQLIVDAIHCFIFYTYTCGQIILSYLFTLYICKKRSTFLLNYFVMNYLLQLLVG